MLFNFLNWTWDEGFEDFIRTGKPARIHQEMSHDEWRVYQRAMRSLASFSAFEVARRTPVPRGALHMLDIGGFPRYFSVIFFLPHPKLHTGLFDLSEGFLPTPKIPSQEGVGQGLVPRAARALTAGLG